MSFDRYSTCPCGSGKKVKFCCCRDIVHALERVIRALDGDQRAAAVDQVDRLLARYGDRPGLLTLKAEAQMGLGDWENVEQTMAALSAAAPDSPVALAQAAIAEANKGNCEGAVRKLQRAIERIQEGIASIVFEAITIVARVLLAQGFIGAARKHLLLEASIGAEDEEDQEAVALLMRINGSPDMPLLWKEDFELVGPPEGVAWKADFEEALRLAKRAAWLAACEKLEPLASQAPDEPTIHRNLAILREWLGDEPSAAAAWRRYSTANGVPLDDAVEAEARAQLLQPKAAMDLVQSLKITYPITDIEKLMERLLSDRRTCQMNFDPAERADDDEPPPKAVFMLLDRPLPAASAGLTRATAPLAIGYLSVFGRQTDREARLELLVTRTEDFPSKIQVLTELTQDLAGPAANEEVVDEIPVEQEALSWTWRLPDDTPRELYETLLADQQRALVFEVWPALSLRALDGKRPCEIAGDPDYRVRLLALLLRLELVIEQRRWNVDFRELHGQLDVPDRGPIDPADVDVPRLPLVRLSRLVTGKLSKKDLIVSFRRAAYAGALKASRVLALEAVGRDDLDGSLPRSSAYELLVNVAYNSDEALAFNRKGREAAIAEGRSPAQWLIQELAIRMGRGEVEASQRLVQRIQTEHGDEPGARQALYELLVRTGAISLDQARAAAQRRASQPSSVMGQAAGGTPTRRLWTPGSDVPPEEGGRDKPTIWTPDQG